MRFFYEFQSRHIKGYYTLINSAKWLWRFDVDCDDCCILIVHTKTACRRGTMA